MSLTGEIIINLLCFLITFVYIRTFLYGIKRYRLNNSAHKKLKKGETFKEWFFYSRYKKVIPVFWRIIYFALLLVHLTILVLCIFFNIINQLCAVCEVLVKGLIFYDLSHILIIGTLFYSSKSIIAYERWISKKYEK